ncbi:MAG TPA: histidine kinase N-terminal 7TM domain-containing protein [Pseudobacteroides sp.]|uniref:histidine kinase N-terminal 7TM domain-containing protein n=1 Tax=Pseudobacteroides sp. TaxID=1968840 RepID=UPI002F946F35
MRFLLSTNGILPVISAILSFFMVVYFMFKAKKSSLFICYVCCQTLVFVWSLGYACELMAQEYSNKLIFMKVNYFCICFLSLGWLIFCNLFAENRSFFKKKSIIPAALIPFVNYLVVLTNDYHKIFKDSIGGDNGRRVYFWIIVFVTYVYIFLGILVLTRKYSKQIRILKIQTLALILAVLIPIISNFLSVTGIVKVNYDLTPVSFSLTMLIVAIATFKYRFLDLVPIARREIVEKMNDSVLVFNLSNKVIDWNMAFLSNILADEDSLKDVDISLVFSKIKSISTGEIDAGFIECVMGQKPSMISTEITIIHPTPKTYHVKLQPVLNRHGDMLAKTLTFTDITLYRELTITKERNRIAHDVHDTLGHTMTLLISVLEVANITYKSDVDTTGDKLKEALKISKEGLKELRRSITGLRPEKLNSNSLITSLNNMFSDFRLSGVEIDFTSEGMEPHDIERYSDIVYRVCQEALTNSIKHGKAKNVSIILRFDAKMIKLFILDDGIGCGKIVKGFGLSGMEERLKAVNGTIIYGSDGESGFNLRVEIPLNKS